MILDELHRFYGTQVRRLHILLLWVIVAVLQRQTFLMCQIFIYQPFNSVFDWQSHRQKDMWNVHLSVGCSSLRLVLRSILCFIWHIPECLAQVQNAWHAVGMCTEMKLCRGDKVRKASRSRAALFFQHSPSRTFPQCQECHVSLVSGLRENLCDPAELLEAGQLYSGKLDISASWLTEGTIRSPAGSHRLLCSFSSEEACSCYPVYSFVTSCAFSLISPLGLTGANMMISHGEKLDASFQATWQCVK